MILLPAIGQPTMYQRNIASLIMEHFQTPKVAMHISVAVILKATMFQLFVSQ
jgi:hypothetical protein